MVNVQHGNVGNRGDILKHAALTQLGSALRKRVDSDVSYVETHSFLLSAPLGDTNEWKSISKLLAESHDGYTPYIDLEQDMISRGEYRCSAGLAQDVIAPSATYLAESDLQTRERLALQVEQEELSGVTLVEAASNLPNAVRGNRRRGFLMLVDPFEDPTEFWPIVNRIVQEAPRTELVGAIVVFAYRKSALAWPSPPEGFKGPVATIEQLPFQLAVYATDRFEQDSIQALASLGWVMADSN
jgi:23S rRNA A2030 N6-methylase RlmJ